MHVQLRRSRGERDRGSVQLYLGRTSPLEVISKREGRVQLSADKRYRALDPALFEDDRALRKLEELRPRLEAFVGRVASGGSTNTASSKRSATFEERCAVCRHRGSRRRDQAQAVAMATNHVIVQR
jgi:hypothetical protein